MHKIFRFSLSARGCPLFAAMEILCVDFYTKETLWKFVKNISFATRSIRFITTSQQHIYNHKWPSGLRGRSVVV